MGAGRSVPAHARGRTEVERTAQQHEDLIDALAAQERALCLRVSSEHRRETTTTALTVIGSRGLVAG